MNLIFYIINGHYGDLHFTRSYISDIIQKTNYNNYHLLLSDYFSKKVLLDIDNLIINNINSECLEEETYYIINENIYINLHFYRHFNTANFGGISINSKLYSEIMLSKYFNLYFSYIFNKLSINIENEFYYTPNIKNYSKYNISNINNYLKKESYKILISNGEVKSNQSSNNLNFKEIVNRLSDSYKEIEFILTKKINLNKNNILFTDDIINDNDNDLNEIAYLSKFCNIIVGRGSGPYCFTINSDNYKDKEKTFISICDSYSIGFFTRKHSNNRIFINKYDEHLIINIIDNFIKNDIIKYINKNNIKNIKITKEDNKFLYSSISDLKNINIRIYKEKSNNLDMIYSHNLDINKNVNYFIKPNRIICDDDLIKIEFYHLEEKINEIYV